MNNTHVFAKTVIDSDLLAKVTGNHYRVLSVNPYPGKGDLPEGVTVNALILEDTAPDGFYGVKSDGITPREGVIYQNISFTLLTGSTAKAMKDIHAGDEIAVYDFDEAHSYYIDFNLILRYRRYKKVSPEGKNDDSQHSN